MSSHPSEKESLIKREEKQNGKGLQGPKGPRIYTDEVIEKEAKALIEWIDDDSQEKIYLGSFARKRGYGRQRLSEFAKSNKKFADAYEEAKAWQEEFFMKKGLTREWDPAFTARCMARVCSNEWKNSWDQQEQVTQIQTPQVVINKIVSSKVSEEQEND